MRQQRSICGPDTAGKKRCHCLVVNAQKGESERLRDYVSGSHLISKSKKERVRVYPKWGHQTRNHWAPVITDRKWAVSSMFQGLIGPIHTNWFSCCFLPRRTSPSYIRAPMPWRTCMLFNVHPHRGSTSFQRKGEAQPFFKSCRCGTAIDMSFFQFLKIFG